MEFSPLPFSLPPLELGNGLKEGEVKSARSHPNSAPPNHETPKLCLF